MTIDDDDGPAMKEFLALIMGTLGMVGVNPMFARAEMREWLERAGFVDIEEVVVDCGFGRKIARVGRGAGDVGEDVPEGLVERSAWSMEVAVEQLVGVVKCEYHSPSSCQRYQ